MVISALAAEGDPMANDQPWKPAQATDEIRKLARNDRLKITYTSHIRERLAERDLTTGDVFYVLKNGFVYEHPAPSTQQGLYKYRMETKTPNSGNRTLRLVVIPDPNHNDGWMKLVTLMFIDET